MRNLTAGCLLASIFLISSCLLAFEIILTRLLSVILSYHYVFAVISMALVGLGSGGIFVRLVGSRIAKKFSDFSILIVFASLCSLAMALSTQLVIFISHGGNIFSNILAYCFILFVPFFFGGAFLAEVFFLYPELSSKMYGADLVGAASGCLFVVFSLNIIGGISSVLLFSFLTSCAAVLLAFGVEKQ